MDGIRQYIIGIVSAAILCSVISSITGKTGFLSGAIKLITGVFMLLAIVAPVCKLRFTASADIFENISNQADAITTSASASSNESICRIIKDNVQAYILDKANSYGVDLTVDVTLTEGEIPAPVSVSLTGDIAPYTKRLLSEMIEKDLGIGTEAQIWN